MLRGVLHLRNTLLVSRILVLASTIVTSVYSQNYRIYFGDLHSHTSFSDGQGTPSEAYRQARKYGADFMAVTDHSYKRVRTFFDSTINIANHHTTKDFVAIAGFEMTKSWGHMNVFNSQWYEWRDIDRDSFYTLLIKDTMCIAQWNHPTEKFDEFNGFRNYSPQLDKVINLLEIMNMRRSLIFESSYIKALDQGWHVAPTANSDAHFKEWIKAYSTRTAILATELTREKLFEALKKRRVYSTENSNLHIYYSINDSIMGSILHKPSHCLVKIEIFDPDTSDKRDKITSVQIIANGGRIIASHSCMDHKVQWTELLNKKNSTYSYYYVKVQNSRGQLAFTAPIWIEGNAVLKKTDISENNRDIEVYDLSGRLVHKRFLELNKYPQKLPKGVYIALKSGQTKTRSGKYITLLK